VRFCQRDAGTMQMQLKSSAAKPAPEKAASTPGLEAQDSAILISLLGVFEAAGDTRGVVVVVVQGHAHNKEGACSKRSGC